MGKILQCYPSLECRCKKKKRLNIKWNKSYKTDFSVLYIIDLNNHVDLEGIIFYFILF